RAGAALREGGFEVSDGYQLEPAELEELKKTLRSASDELGMKDFTEKATLDGALTVQDLSPYENVEETVGELINKLSEFCTETYPNVMSEIQEFINRTHNAITTSANNVHANLKAYNEQEDEGSRIVRDAYPN
ncbi:MAG: hypothetical protein LC775_07540, partial [Acidobacteria bacterium]|nr:hypothetical protein [Acidobacteriota bacterium]